MNRNWKKRRTVLAVMCATKKGSKKRGKIDWTKTQSQRKSTALKREGTTSWIEKEEERKESRWRADNQQHKWGQRYATAFWTWCTLVRALEDITPGESAGRFGVAATGRSKNTEKLRRWPKYLVNRRALPCRPAIDMTFFQGAGLIRCTFVPTSNSINRLWLTVQFRICGI